MDPPPPAQPAVSPETVESSNTPICEDHDDKYGVPTLDELGKKIYTPTHTHSHILPTSILILLKCWGVKLGFDTENLRPPVWIGGETEALARLERHLERKAWVASFGRPKMTPQSLLASQTGLSPYLRFGCLSTRLFYHQLTGVLYQDYSLCTQLYHIFRFRFVQKN